jgi:hypothetical protein
MKASLGLDCEKKRQKKGTIAICDLEMTIYEPLWFGGSNVSLICL